MVKGEIACFEQLILLSHCFQKSSAEKVSESVYKWERVKLTLFYPLPYTKYAADNFENIWAKE